MNSGVALIHELMNSPEEFVAKAGPNALLHEYFRGLPLDTLRPLLRHGNLLIQRAAVFIASELGGDGRALVDDVIPLLASADREVAYDALIAVTAFTSSFDADRFEHVIRALENEDEVLRRLAMRMVSNSPTGTLQGALKRFRAFIQSDPEHRIGLTLLIKGDQLLSEEFQKALAHGSPLIRRYAAIAARRLMKTMPKCIASVASCDDPELRTFAEGELNPPAWDSWSPAASHGPPTDAPSN